MQPVSYLRKVVDLFLFCCYFRCEVRKFASLPLKAICLVCVLLAARDEFH
jgi:hypothetical protein